MKILEKDNQVQNLRATLPTVTNISKAKSRRQVRCKYGCLHTFASISTLLWDLKMRVAIKLRKQKPPC